MASSRVYDVGEGISCQPQLLIVHSETTGRLKATENSGVDAAAAARSISAIWSWKAGKVCIPVISTLKAKSPLPTVST